MKAKIIYNEKMTFPYELRSIETNEVIQVYGESACCKTASECRELAHEFGHEVVE